jgi:acetyl esterase/lipase
LKLLFDTVNSCPDLASTRAMVISRLFLSAIIVGAVGSSALAQRRLPDGVEVVRDVQFGMGGERALKLDILRPKTQPAKPMPVIVFAHGGGWQAGDRRTGVPLLAPFAARGYFCATIDYRLSGEAIFPAQIEDCKCAIRFLRAKAKEYNLDPKRIGVWGSSAGGHLVALLGTSGGEKSLEGKGGYEKESSRVQAVCDWFGPADFNVSANANWDAPTPVSKLLGGSMSEKKDLAAKASPVTYASKDDPPFLIMHGDGDRVVPLKQSELMHAALKKVGVESTFHVVKGKGHGFRGPDVEKPVADFFDRILKPGK